MRKLLTTILLLSFLGICGFARAAEIQNVEIPMRDYDAIEVPAGSFIPVMSAQEISTQYCSEGYKVKFISTNDLFLFDTNIIPQDTEFYGYIEKMNEPVVGTNAALKIKINKMILADGYEIPIRGYIYTTNNNTIGGGISEPTKYVKMPHYITSAKGKATLSIRPGQERKMGTHTTITSGANLIIILTDPAYITHTLTN